MHTLALKQDTEVSFNQQFLKCVNLILAAKDETSNLDRLMDFVGGYISFLKEKEEDTSSKFAHWILNYLVNGVEAKHKSVRYRCLKLIYACSSSLSSIEDTLFQHLKQKVCSRPKDTEWLVRREVANCLSILQMGELENEPLIKSTLEYLMIFDVNSQVQRQAMLSVTLDSTNQALIAERSNDVDITTRKAFFRRVMSLFPDYQSC
jgi:condensin complex subunit 3